MSNSQDKFIIRQDTHEERSNGLKNVSTEMIQIETGREKKSDKNQHPRTVELYQMVKYKCDLRSTKKGERKQGQTNMCT